MAISKISATELATVVDTNTLVSTYSASGTTIERERHLHFQQPVEPRQSVMVH